MRAAPAEVYSSPTSPESMTPNTRSTSPRAKPASAVTNRSNSLAFASKDFGSTQKAHKNTKGTKEHKSIFPLRLFVALFCAFLWLYVEVSNVERVILDELSPWLDRVTH